jgi:hypothetical protein
MILMPIVTDEVRPRSAASGPALVAKLLDEQQSLTAVERFSQWHEEAGSGEHGARSRKSAGPSEPPGPPPATIRYYPRRRPPLANSTPLKSISTAAPAAKRASSPATR